MTTSAAATTSSRLTRPDRSTSFETFYRWNDGSWYLTVDNATTLHATFCLVKPVNQRLGLGPFLLRDVEVHDVLGDVFELAQLLLKTCITIM
jgi:hypothetical protein